MKKTFLLVAILFFGFASANGQIVINEIMYNSTGTDIEFIELYNNSSSTIHVQDWYILDDNDSHDKCYLEGGIGPGAFLVVAGDISLFTGQYPSVTAVSANDFNPATAGWSFGNGGDTVRLFNNSGVLQDSVAYGDSAPWPGSPDGNGPSLELLHPNLDNGLPASWDPSESDWGTPGMQNSVYTLNVAPVCKDGSRDIELPGNTDIVTIEVIAYDYEGLAQVNLFVNTGSGYASQPMYNDGSHGDSAASDSVFTAQISPQAGGTLVQYYVIATDLVAQTDSWPSSAPGEYRAYTVDHVLPQLRINEILASNTGGLTDENGENDDWFEIYNYGLDPVNLNGMFVSDGLNDSRGFQLPDVTMAPGEYLIVWADSDQEQGILHTNFKLSASGESAAIFETVDHGNVRIHGWKYGRMSSDVSMGYRTENSTAPEYLATPTPGADNSSSELFSPICINEFQCTSDFGGVDDWLEIYNRGTVPWDISGWFLSDERGNNTKWIFPVNTVLSPGEYLVIYEDVLGFGFSSEGKDVIMLTAADTVTGIDFYDFGPQSANVSEGRYPDGSDTWYFFDPPSAGLSNPDPSTSVEEIELPAEFILAQNYPNPFNPVTTIQYQLTAEASVTLSIYNVTGRLIEKRTAQNVSAGPQKFIWNARGFSTGIYFYRIEVESKLGSSEYSEMRKMLLLK